MNNREEWEELEKYELLETPKIQGIDYKFTKSDRRKYVMKRLLIEKKLQKQIMNNYFSQKRDAKSFVFDLTKIYEVVNENDQNVWLKLDFLIDSGLYVRKKVKKNGKINKRTRKINKRTKKRA